MRFWFFNRAVVSAFIQSLSLAPSSRGRMYPIKQNVCSPSHIAFVDGEVLKHHAGYIKPSEIERRLNLISLDALNSLFLQPLSQKPQLDGGCALTIWPHATPFNPDSSSQDVPWNECAAHLAALHNADLDPGRIVLTSGWLPRLSRSLAKLRGMLECAERSLILEASQTLPHFSCSSWNLSQNSIIHGDWHPGQMVYFENRLVFIDIDDVGLGNRMFDLAKPAAFFLSGLLESNLWNEFRESYENSCQMAKVNRDHFWKDLELPARASVIQSAITALAHASESDRKLADFEAELIKTCQRVTQCYSRRIV